MKTIVTLTVNPCVDLSTAVEHVFPNHKLRCGPLNTEPGGGGLNVSRAIKRLGGESVAVYCCGGPTGELLRALVSKENIDGRSLQLEGWTRQSMTVCESTTGHQYRFVIPGPTFHAHEWQLPLDLLQTIRPKPEIIVASGSLAPGIPVDFYTKVARIAGEIGALLFLDTSGEPLEKAVEEDVFLIKPSLRELRAISRCRVDNEADQARAALAIVRRGHCSNVVLSLGAAGVLLVNGEGSERIHAPVVSVRSRVGAGDCMVAGIVMGIATEKSLREAVAYGVLCGTAAVMNAGTGLCRKDDVDWLCELRADKKLDCDPAPLSNAR